MTAPSIEMIAESLRGCSIGRNGAASRRRLPPSSQPPESSSDESDCLLVELNSDVALPYTWEQCLDLRTGEVYYINWRTGARTNEDPRKRTCGGSSPASSCSDSVGTSSLLDEEESCCSSGISSLSSTSSGEITSAPPPHVLVAAGCRACFMYFMVPKRLDSCPKCSGRLLHLGRDG